MGLNSMEETKFVLSNRSDYTVSFFFEHLSHSESYTTACHKVQDFLHMFV
jgi:hypothetical protein